ncbi:hypothetical protein HYU89_00950 [Candidatus Collierbacteria bacterium]|nr:hypothetical protein [Candidatus Collierbacteria bacterium]
MNQKTKIKAIIFWFSALLFALCSLLFALFWFRGWNGKEPINVVVASGEKIWVLGVRAAEKRLVEISVPGNTIVTVGRGKWQARSLGRLSKLEKSPDVLKSVGWALLEVPVDSVAEISDYEGENTGYFSQLKLLSRFNFTSLTETIKLIRFIKGLNDNQVLKINIGETMVARIITDPAGTELMEVDSEALSLQLAEWFKIESLRNEGLAVAIINTSGKTNAGSKLARQLEHVGLRVVSVSSGEGTPGITIKQKSIANSETVRKISGWLNLKPIVADFDERADILIVIK